MGFRQLTKKIKSKKGQSMVEMALTLPLIIMCIGIIITSGQLFLGKITAQMAAYEGARTAIVIDDRNNAAFESQQRATDIMANAVGVEQETVNYIFQPHSSWTQGNYLEYSVEADVITLFPIPDSNFNLHSTTTVTGKINMMIERNP